MKSKQLGRWVLAPLLAMSINSTALAQGADQAAPEKNKKQLNKPAAKKQHTPGKKLGQKSGPAPQRKVAKNSVTEKKEDKAKKRHHRAKKKQRVKQKVRDQKAEKEI
jgi:hypothetical protein